MPQDGESELIETLHWLREELDEGNFARQETEAFQGEALALRFRRIEHALVFLSGFPKPELADRTKTRAHTWPLVPGGRTL